MEAIGAGANVAAFVVIGLQSAKICYNTLSAIKDGPVIVQQVANDVLQLDWILRDQSTARAAAQDTPLVGYIRICREQLDEMAAAIGKFQTTPDERKAGKLWKRFKSFLGEKRLEIIGANISRQVGFLGLRIENVNLGLAYESQDCNVKMAQEIRNVGGIIQKQADTQITNFSDLSRSLSTLQSHHVVQDRKIESLEDSLLTELKSHEQDVRSGLVSIKNEMEAVTSVSSQQSIAMRGMLQEITEIKSRLIDTSSHTNDPSRGATDSSTSQQNETSADDGLIQSITRLSGLIQEKDRAFDTYADDDPQAQSIVQDLQAILDSARKQGNILQQIRDSHTYHTDSAIDKAEVHTGLRRFDRSFGQDEIILNQGGRKQSRPHRTIMQQSHTHAVLDVGLGTLAFRSTKRKRPSSAAEGDDRHRKRALIDYAMSLTFLPTDPKKCHMLVATIFQEESSMRGVSSISRLMVNRVLPAGSPVFELVREGRLRELQEMMHRGEASLRDHDEYGISLLFYATRQPEMCKFLLSNGLDVDHMARHPYSKRLRTILNCELNAGSSLPPNEFSAVQRCRRLLLEAGADPTAQDFLRMAIATRHTETVGLASQDFGWPWPHINNLKWSFNRPAISVSCTGWLEDLVVTKEFISQLLDLGADIHLRADDGETCLHAFFQQKTLKFPTIDFSEVYSVLELLLAKGADVYACDNLGWSVSRAAYSGCHRCTSIIGSYTGDLWDAVLQSRGFDLAEFRHGYQRRAKYTKSYTRHNFEALWKGREALCPYWDDTPWPPEGTCGMTSENSGSVPCRACQQRSRWLLMFSHEDESYEDETDEDETDEDEIDEDECECEEDGSADAGSYKVKTQEQEQDEQPLESGIMVAAGHDTVELDLEQETMFWEDAVWYENVVEWNTPRGDKDLIAWGSPETVEGGIFENPWGQIEC